MTVTGRRIRSGAAAAAGALALGAVLAACGGSNGGSGSTSTSESGGNAAGAKVVTVRMTDYRLALSSKTFTAGDYTFVAENDGHTLHSLEVEGKGAEKRLSNDLQPGQSGKLTITLKDGDYELYCPVDGHKDRGMKTEITVGSGGGGGGGSETTSPGNGY